MTTINPNDAADKALASINATNGATVSLVVGVPSPTSGYAVSLPGHELIDHLHVRPEWKAAEIWSDIHEYATAHKDVLAQAGFYLGAWLDGDRLVLDVSQVVDSLPAAVSLGQLHEAESPTRHGLTGRA